MTRLPRSLVAFLVAIAAGALVLAGQQCGARSASAEIALAKAERDTARAAERRAIETRARADTVHHHDTVRLTTVRRRADTVLARVTDTVLHVDTVRVLLAEERRACDAALLSCNARVAAADSVGAALRRQLTAVDRIAGLTRGRWYHRLGVWGGYGAMTTPDGEVRHGAQLGAGVRLWAP